MSNVYQFKPRPVPRKEVIDYYGGMFERAKTGEVQGVIGIASIEGGADEIEICGNLADDFSYASRVAMAGFNSMLGYKGCVEPIRKHRGLPRGLRKEESNDEAVSPPAFRRG